MTAEVDEKGCPGVRSWVKEIHNRRAVICASATSDTLQERNTDITLPAARIRVQMLPVQSDKNVY